jgi:hypothetical protein
MVGAMARRPVAVPVEGVVPGQQPVERREQVLVRAGTDLEDRDARGRVRDEYREQSVAFLVFDRFRDERRAGRGQVDDARDAPGPDRELASPYGKMLRSASRIRLSPLFPGTDS